MCGTHPEGIKRRKIKIRNSTNKVMHILLEMTNVQISLPTDSVKASSSPAEEGDKDA